MFQCEAKHDPSVFLGLGPNGFSCCLPAMLPGRHRHKCYGFTGCFLTIYKTILYIFEKCALIMSFSLVVRKETPMPHFDCMINIFCKPSCVRNIGACVLFSCLEPYCNKHGAYGSVFSLGNIDFSCLVRSFLLHPGNSSSGPKTHSNFRVQSARCGHLKVATLS
ncbi:hypothetical protein ILYODFUR_006279 [Ilyodon furcidens]|uniref:Uncharacterized protein n=1 Tax=Ilyodon furcidens TaxID=33524 RepID=A0ABV0UQW0_9TELE